MFSCCPLTWNPLIISKYRNFDILRNHVQSIKNTEIQDGYFIFSQQYLLVYNWCWIKNYKFNIRSTIEILVRFWNMVYFDNLQKLEFFWKNIQFNQKNPSLWKSIIFHYSQVWNRNFFEYNPVFGSDSSKAQRKGTCKWKFWSWKMC